MIADQSTLWPVFPMKITVEDTLSGDKCHLVLTVDGVLTGDLELAKKIMTNMRGPGSISLLLLAVAIRQQLADVGHA